MFKSFTWTKFFADITTVVGVVTSPVVLGFIPAKVAGILVGIGVAVRAITSLFTTSQAGTATVASGQQVNEK